MAEEKKRFWLKIEKDFLKSSHIKVIKKMPNGNDYIVFYLAIMLESVETVGHLRFSQMIPYNEDMLAAVTDTNIDIVRSAIKIFTNLGLVQLLDNGTFFLPEVPKKTGKESDSAERVRQYRVRENKQALQCNTDVTKCNANIEYSRVDIELEKSREEGARGRAHARGEFQNIYISDEQLTELVQRFSEQETNKAISQMSAYLKAHGKTYKDYHAALITWINKNLDAPQSNKNQSQSADAPEWEKCGITKEEYDRIYAGVKRL